MFLRLPIQDNKFATVLSVYAPTLQVETEVKGALYSELHNLLQQVDSKDKFLINCSARLICKASKSAHITPLLFDLHWLPISSRIQYKIALTCFHVISGTAPQYLSELLHLYSPSRSLR